MRKPTLLGGALFRISRILILVSGVSSAATLQVGPGQTYAKPCAAIAAAAAGDTILIDATGTYTGDVCTWTKNGLVLRGVNGRPHIDAAGANSGGKGTWVIDGNDNVVENIEFSGAVDIDANGAGIRFEGINLTVRGCYFHDNQDGILTNNGAGSEILVEYSEFARNGAGDGISHNIYVNHVAKLTFQFNYTHDAVAGHLLKTRAAENYILYNKLTTATGTTSYEVDVPNGGLTYLIGNVILQGPYGQNNTFVSYMREGPNSLNPLWNLYVINNTFVNQQSNSIFLNIYTGDTTPVIARNNIFSGLGTVVNQTSAVLSNNLSGTDPQFVNPAANGYHLLSTSPAINAGANPGSGSGMALAPAYEYVQPTCGKSRKPIGAIDLGAFEFGNSATPLPCQSFGTPSLAGISVTPSSLLAGAPATGTVQLDYDAPAGGLSMALASSIPSAAAAPTTVTVPAGAANATFQITTGGVAAVTPVTFTASYAGVSKTAVVTVNPLLALSGISVSPSSLVGGAGSTGTVQLAAAAPAGGSSVTIASSNTLLASAPASVLIPAGSASASFAITTAATTISTVVTFTATYWGVSKTAILTVNPLLALSAVSVSPSSVIGGAGSTGTVQLTAAAPTGGSSVSVASSNALLASAPASVLVPAGFASASFAITTAATTVSTAVTFTATYSGVSKTASLNVTTGPTFLLAGNSSELPALINGTAVTPTIAPAGLTGHLVVRGTGAAAFASANATDGLVFSQPGQQAANTAFLSFAGAPIGAMFNMNEGDLTFYLKSSYSLAERLTGGGAYRFAFQVDDGTQRLFFFAVSAANSRLVFSYATGSASSISYAVPVGQEDVVFGKNFAAKFRLAWDGVRTTLYINDTNVNSVPYTPAIPNWTSSASFTIGATSLYPYGGGYFGNDDAIADFQLK